MSQFDMPLMDELGSLVFRNAKLVVEVQELLLGSPELYTPGPSGSRGSFLPTFTPFGAVAVT